MKIKKTYHMVNNERIVITTDEDGEFEEVCQMYDKAFADLENSVINECFSGKNSIVKIPVNKICSLQIDEVKEGESVEKVRSEISTK